MDMFITRFDTFQALAQYPEDWLIELLEQNADRQIIERYSAKIKQGTTSWDKNKSTKKKKEDKSKGCDWSKSIQGMSLDKARAWFKDYKNLAAKSGKA